MKFGMGVGLKNSRNYNAGYAMQFNGTDEYLTRALPTNLLTGTTSDFTSAGSRPTGWDSGLGVTWNQTGILGSTGTNVIKISANGGYAIYENLTVDKKYKLKVRYQSNVPLRLSSDGSGNRYGTLPATSQWNTVYITFTTVNTKLSFNFGTGVSGTAYIDVINITEDWKLDLNESYELIKHSMNRDFERTLGAEIATGTVTIGEKVYSYSRNS